MKITNMMKVLLDEDTRKLIKAGFLDSCLGLTSEGEEVLFSLMVEKFKKELLEKAQEKIDDDSKKKK